MSFGHHSPPRQSFDPHVARRVRLLTDREREVLALLSAGRSNLGIALGLFITQRTVETHIRRMLLTLDVPESPDVHRRVLLTRAYLDRPSAG